MASTRDIRRRRADGQGGRTRARWILGWIAKVLWWLCIAFSAALLALVFLRFG